MNLHELPTEGRNDATRELDRMSVAQVLAVMNEQDRTVPDAVERVLPQIAQAVELVTATLRAGGRLVYVGAGTSGRLALLDAVECPPTFGTDPGRVIALLAGGAGAFAAAVEGAEDNAADGAAALDSISLTASDVVVGLAASGRTPYVIGALRRARELGAPTVSIACNPAAEVSAVADVAIEAVTGPEVLTGSTRLKAGTAQKLICNMISTAAMVGLGKVYENLMVDVRPTNAKLVDRAQRIVQEATGAPAEQVAAALAGCANHPKTAIVMLLAGVSAREAHERLATADGFVRDALA